MIRRHRAVTGGKLGAPLVRQLLGVQLDRQAEGLGFVKNTRYLGRGEADGLAEGIDRIGKPRRGDSRNRLVPAPW